MKKRLLSKVPIEEANEEYINLARETEETRYLISASEIEVEEKKMLLLYFYHHSDLKEENTKAAFRVFLSKDDYITQDLSATTIKWRTGSISSLTSSYYWSWYNGCIFVDKKSSEIIKGFLNTKEDPLTKIDELQKKIMAKRLENKHQKIKKKIDKQMEKVPKLPWGFKRWIDNTALFHSRYIYYEYKPRKKLDGYCTHCKTDVVVEAPRHNKKGICPNCNSQVTYKAMGKSRRVRDEGQAALIQKVEDGIIVRYFSITKTYNKDYRNPSLTYTELARDFYNNKDKMKSYEYMHFKQTEEVRWCDGQGKYGFHDAVLYEKNLDKVLEGTTWEYSAIKEFATHKKGFRFSVYSYLEKYKQYPVIEYLVKLKLYKLTEECLNMWSPREINLEGKTMKEVLDIDKSQLTVAQRINAGSNEIRVIKEAAKANLKLTDEQIKLIARHIRIDWVIELSKYTTVYKMLKYISSISGDDERISNRFSDWRDYIKNCRVLKYDLKNEFVLFPSNFEEAHDMAYQLVDKNKKELFDKAIKDLCKEIGSFYNWEYKNYLIVFPSTAAAITKEGQTLHHCVGTYTERVAKGESIVLFLRKKDKPNKPYYTIEVSPRDFRVIQCRGKNNKSMGEEIKKIVNKYEEEKLKPLIYKKAM